MEEKYFQNPEEHIQKGDYCYGKKGLCPFWDKNTAKPEQENGYCHFLKKGDWDINAEGGVIFDPKTGVKYELEYYPFGGLLWDRVKECEVNKEFDIEEKESKENE